MHMLESAVSDINEAGSRNQKRTNIHFFPTAPHVSRATSYPPYQKVGVNRVRLHSASRGCEATHMSLEGGGLATFGLQPEKRVSISIN
jgi:hypothetical protein